MNFHPSYMLEAVSANVSEMCLLSSLTCYACVYAVQKGLWEGIGGWLCQTVCV